MNIDPKKAKQLGCTAVCPVPIRYIRYDAGHAVLGADVRPVLSHGLSTHELPSTPHNAGLCVVLIIANEKLVLRVTHVRSGFALGLEHGDYPATKTGMAAALHELELLLPIADWTRSADDLASVKVEADAIVQRCRRAFPGKLVGNVVKRDVAEPAPEIVKWRVYSQDTTAGEWSFVELAHEDHLINAVDEALTKPGTSAALMQVDDVRCDGTRHAFDFDHELRLYVCPLTGRREVIVNRTDRGFDLVCEQRTALIEKLAQAERELKGVDNPRKTLGVWKSGPKFGQLKLSAKLPPGQCVEMLAQQDRYDEQARKVEAIRADLHRLNGLLAKTEPIPERVTKLCPRETPNGKDDAVKLLGMLRVQADASKRFLFGAWTTSFMFDKCIAQLEKNLREYDSVELHGFAPGRGACSSVTRVMARPTARLKSKTSS